MLQASLWNGSTLQLPWMSGDNTDAKHWVLPLGALALPLIDGAQVTFLNPHCKACWDSKVLSSILRSAQINCFIGLLKSLRVTSHNHLLIFLYQFF